MVKQTQESNGNLYEFFKLCCTKKETYHDYRLYEWGEQSDGETGRQLGKRVLTWT